MKSITINGSQRESVGKKATKALRNAGQVPCVLYGGDKPVHFSAPELAFSKLVYTPNAHTVVIELADGSTFNAVLQDIQFHPVTDRILHVDFYQLFDDKEIALFVPVNLVGNSRGVKNGGVLRKNNRKLRVKALPANLPDFIEIDITPLKIGDKVSVRDLNQEKYTLLHSDNTVVCQIKTSRTAVVDIDEDEEEGAEEAAEATQE
ncbi:50S ribosomal protein L25/general stress protein Ctc [Oceanihabitans sediminis]|uniref:Large ribosomal subunit protein bL25 n=1 Tax=Oceanihabitans sediminis TaxID=1812012 RepID=A0A368P5I3_9FLAO|nr:50S ribosomal protein L25/general stress protein Ctc [Oceanihabitans sediminis]MDX1277458.1 50S ribosomal protein L25/general stress protein Ctc [Oceanihabitans sediminis]MDX1772799.1 50S ribosomal protein L25/general stress protein Ctc [Oceanihabitans sediminis]RBP34477.1 LSU ribosomal protein L25P [Oceanihabitans sediminis]RCU58147.1 50S ribosomal protein L25/general stress protein Ctc [Oceanihabitans sediminis]